MKVTIKRKSYNDYISILIVVHLFLMCGKNMLVALSPFFYKNNAIINRYIIVIFGLLYMYLFCRYSVINRVSKWSWLIIGMLSIFIVVSVVLNPNMVESDNVLERFRTFIAYGIPLFFVFNVCEDPKLVWNRMFRYNKILWVVATYCFFVFMTTGRSNQLDSTYDMSYGNNLMLVILIFIFDYWINSNKISLALSFVSLFYLLAIGSRGPLLSVGIAYIIIFLFKNNNNIYSALFRIIVSFAGFIALFNWKALIKWLNNFCKSIGIESRTISRLGSVSSMLYNSHRDVYHNLLRDSLRDEPLGLGAFGGDYTVGLAHSFYWDVFANFGYVFGTLFIIIFVLAIVIKCIKYNNGFTYFILMYSIMLLPRGFFDGTFWGSYEMWIIMAILFNKNSKISGNNFVETS